MIDPLRALIIAQFEAALSMFGEAIKACPPEHWEGKVATDSMRQIAYHTLFFVDLYLSPSEEAFTLRELNQRGGDEHGPVVSPGLSQAETLEYLAICLDKVRQTLASETESCLFGPSGHKKFSRAEMHVYNIRHIQHHAGQFSAYLRRVCDRSVPWVRSGWQKT